MAAGHDAPDLETYFDRWAITHGGYHPRSNVLVCWWLAIAYAVARPLAAARVPPDVVTIAGLLAAGVVALLARGDGSLLLGAAVMVVVTGLLDNVDGAVAVLRDRVTSWGAYLDSVTDRVGDLLMVLALGLAGAPWQVCVLGGTLMFLLEYARARATVAGMPDVGVITVWERPTRVIVTAGFLASAAALGDPWPALGSWAWVGLGIIGLVQLTVVVRRALH
ncbi:MAG: CDP-alcohol phosphatidyltransferase family protein [Sporichthyaceae bacterium]